MHLTPSQFKKIMTFDAKGNYPSKTALSYVDEIVLGFLGVERDEITAASLEHGKELEPFAIQRYQEETLAIVTPCTGTVFHPELKYVCGHLDSYVGKEGILETKCPWNPVNHLQNILDKKQIDDYIWQIQGYLWITGRKWCDFVSYDLRFPEHLQIVIHRVDRDEELISKLAEFIPKFWIKVQERLSKIPNS